MVRSECHMIRIETKPTQSPQLNVHVPHNRSGALRSVARPGPRFRSLPIDSHFRGAEVLILLIPRREQYRFSTILATELSLIGLFQRPCQWYMKGSGLFSDASVRYFMESSVPLGAKKLSQEGAPRLETQAPSKKHAGIMWKNFVALWVTNSCHIVVSTVGPY